MKKILSKLLILVLVFMAVIGLYFYKNRKKEDNEVITMGKPTLPTVTFVTTGDSSNEENMEINELFGYTNEMEAKYMRDSITPLKSDRNLHIKVNNRDNVVMSAKYEIRSIDTERLVEKTDVKTENIQADGDYTNITLNIDNLITDNTEYVLIFTITTDRHENVNYYTRIIKLSDNYCRQEIDFANNFSNATLDDSISDTIAGYLEPDSSEDNTNYGNVTIHSNFKQVTWGALKPEKVTEPVAKVKEIFGDVASIQLNYKIKAKNDYDADQYYNVKEFFRIKWTSTEIYLLDYSRTTDQVFEANNQNISATRINLGIDSDSGCEFKSNDNGTYIAFVKENGLWLMDIGSNEVISLFAFDDAADDDIRDENNNNDIQVVSVDEDGNVRFIVHGYMNRGEHEGQVGVSLYNYDIKKNEVDEKIFIPFTRPYQILKETLGKLSYVNDNNIMYMMLNNCIYSIDLTGSEYVQIISDLKDGSYAVNKSGNIIAWQTDSQLSGSKTIKELNFETGAEQEIKADEGMLYKVLGFVDDDLVYGSVEESRIVSDASGIKTVPMNELRIVNEKGEILKNYIKEGFYFTDAQIKDNMINLSMVQYNEEGTAFVAANDYQIFGNEEADSYVVTSDIISTELKKKEVVINFIKKVTTSDKLKNISPKQILFSETNSLSIRELISSDNNFYVYGKGKICKITDNVSDAIITAYDQGGVVVNEAGNYVWARISKPTQYNVGSVNISQTANQGDGTMELAVCLNGMLAFNGVTADAYTMLAQGNTAETILSANVPTKKTIELKGCSLDQVLYYVSKGEPVIAAVDANNYVLITGYDFYNAVMVDPSTGTEYKQGLDEARTMFAQNGNKYVVMYGE